MWFGVCVLLNGCRCACRVGMCVEGYVHGGVDEWVFADICVQVCVGTGAHGYRGVHVCNSTCRCMSVWRDV